MNLREKIESLKGFPIQFAAYRIGYEKCQRDVLEIPELQQTIEKASQFDKMFEGIVVEGECPTCTARGLRSHFGKDCPICNGTGIISRPLTEEEKVEVLKTMQDIVFGTNRDGALIAESGARVVWKK